MAERSNAAVLKTVNLKGFVGSNPTLSSILRQGFVWQATFLKRLKYNKKFNNQNSEVCPAKLAELEGPDKRSLDQSKYFLFVSQMNGRPVPKLEERSRTIFSNDFQLKLISNFTKLLFYFSHKLNIQNYQFYFKYL